MVNWFVNFDDVNLCCLVWVVVVVVVWVECVLEIFGDMVFEYLVLVGKLCVEYW